MATRFRYGAAIAVQGVERLSIGQSIGGTERSRGPAQRRRASTSETPSESELRFIEATADLLSKRGSIDVTFNEISSAVGLNSALIGYYFGNKKALFYQVLLHSAKPSLRDLSFLVDAEMSPRKKIRLHVTGMINTFFKYPFLARLLKYLMDEDNMVERPALAENFLAPVANMQREIIRQGVESGDFAPVNPMHVHLIISGACEKLLDAPHVLSAAFDVHEVTPELKQEYIETALRFILGGLCSAEA